MSGGNAHRLHTTAATDDPLSAPSNATPNSDASQPPMGGQAGAGLSSPWTYSALPNSHNRANANHRTNRQATAAAVGGSPDSLARYGLVSDGHADINSARRASAALSSKCAATANHSALYPPSNWDHDEPPWKAGINGGGHTNNNRSKGGNNGATTHAPAKPQRVLVGSDPLASAVETPLFQHQQQQHQPTSQAQSTCTQAPHGKPPPSTLHAKSSSPTASATNTQNTKSRFHGSSSSLLGSSSLLQPPDSIQGAAASSSSASTSNHKPADNPLFHELSTPSPVAQSSKWDFDSPSPQMIPRSEVKLRNHNQQRGRVDAARGGGGGGGGGDTSRKNKNNGDGSGAKVGVTTTTPATAADIATTSTDSPLFSSPSPVMVPRSEMKQRAQTQQEEGGGLVVVGSEDDAGPWHYCPPSEHRRHHHHHQKLLRRQASTDPLGGGAGRINKGGQAAPSSSRKVRAGEERVATVSVNTDHPPVHESKLDAAEEEHQGEEPTAPPLHASNPALARALWASDDAGAPPGQHHPLDDAIHGGGHSAGINGHIPASGSARVERQRRSSLSGGGSMASTTGTAKGRDSAEGLYRTARWRILLGLLEVPRGNSRTLKSTGRSKRIGSSDGNIRRGSNESKRRGVRPKRRGSCASTGALEEKTWKLNDLSSDEEDDDVPKDPGRGKMQRSHSLGRLLGLGGTGRTDEAGSRRSSFNQTWTSSDFGTAESSSPIASPRAKRRNSLSKLLGIADASDDEGHAKHDDHDAGTELQESQSSSMNLDYLSSEEEPDPPVDTRPVICVPYAGSLDDVAMSELVAHNIDMLEKQRLRYDGLAKRHYWSCKEIRLGASYENKSQAEEAKLNDDGDAAAGASSAAMFDPLSALADEEELKQKREEEMDLQYRKEKARQHLGLPDNADRSANGNVGKTKRRDSACGGSRFTDYYSSAEVLHVIEKDLNRLPPDHVVKYHRRQMKKLGVDVPDDSISFANNSASSGLGDAVDNDDEATKLLRISRSERSKLLGEVLFVYAREHQALGYRQGMHEILSYLLLTMEIDLETQEESNESPEDEGSTQLLEFEFLRNDLYSMFEAVVGRLSPAYDTHSTKGLPATNVKDPSLSPMEVMGESILTKVRDIAGDAILYRTVCQLGVPPQLFCTRWVRLIFAREVEGSQNVLDLWDAFFAIAAEEEAAKRAKESVDDSSDDDDEEDVWLLASLSFMNILESAAASMILLMRERLLAGQHRGRENNAAAMNDALHTLMNPPPLKEATPLADLVRTLVWQQRREARAAAPPNRRGRDLSSGTTNHSSGSSNRPKRRNSLSKLFGLDSEVGSGIADQVRDSMTKISDAIGVATTPTAGAAQSDVDGGMASTPQQAHPPPRRRSQSSGALPAPPPQAEVSRSEGALKGRSNEELATSLGTSVATIMQHLKNTSLNGNIAVPHNVWEALLEINNVGKDIMARDGEYE